MRKVITAKEVEELLRRGDAVPSDALLTPSARDLLTGHGKPTSQPGAKFSAEPATAKSEPTTPDYEFKWNPGRDPRTPAAIEQFFRSLPIQALKQRMCDIGRRLWQREYTDGNGGNITIRVGDNLVLCTPTLICKGFMTPDDMCFVDLEGKQLAGTRVRTSEALTHFGIMRRQPAAKCCIHAHPPHATAFAISKTEIPSCLIPEAEVFLGKIGVARYETPGSPANADEVGKIGRDHQAVLMQNHGVIVWGKDVEDAYWKMENLDSYCRTIWIAATLGQGLRRFSESQVKELIAIRQKLGMPDPRADLKECELCDTNDFRPGVVCNPPVAEQSVDPKADPDLEATIQRITDQILQQFSPADRQKSP